jgi:hypothetical protein
LRRFLSITHLVTQQIFFWRPTLWHQHSKHWGSVNNN